MSERQKRIKRVHLLQEADSLLREALKLGGHHPCFGEAVCDAQIHIDDAVVWADRGQTLRKKYFQ